MPRPDPFWNRFQNARSWPGGSFDETGGLSASREADAASLPRFEIAQLSEEPAAELVFRRHGHTRVSTPTDDGLDAGGAVAARLLLTRHKECRWRKDG